MPIYKFSCTECAEQYEDYRAMNETEENGECVNCGSTEIKREEKVLVECGCADDEGCGGGCGCC